MISVAFSTQFASELITKINWCLSCLFGILQSPPMAVHIWCVTSLVVNHLWCYKIKNIVKITLPVYRIPGWPHWCRFAKKICAPCKGISKMVFVYRFAFKNQGMCFLVWSYRESFTKKRDIFLRQCATISKYCSICVTNGKVIKLLKFSILAL